MSDYRRWRLPGGTFFFTLVTFHRRPILCGDTARRCLHEAFDVVRRDWPFEVVAIVLLPDHLHTVWTLPRDDDRYPIRWKRIKEEFTRRYIGAGGVECVPTPSRERHAERGIWQRRYWEHAVRDEDDLKRCVDYVHWNPQKHGYVEKLIEWRWSSFHRYVSLGEYDVQWGAEDPSPGHDEPEWRE